ncbi:AAA family ATPase [Mucilaginibacter terrae]|uniref:ATPase n=1 Tax=Mucilaginibacter terrae TaxID=1955052 RepID=A0ABU3GN88_9SPHI|nr:AAA family ATPase [Mucilaginibacter terrae]MDT3401250.1 putative ATPase [Mucilaginibacter terrae]
MDFKLLAVRPRTGCNKRFLKNLQAGRVYSFYTPIEYLNDGGNQVSLTDEVESLNIKAFQSPDLYSQKLLRGGMIDVNISAVVGKNGSGKSSLIEFFFAAVYLFSVSQGLLKPNDDSLAEDTLQTDRDLQSARERQDVLQTKKQNISDQLAGMAGKRVSMKAIDKLNIELATISAEQQELETLKQEIINKRKYNSRQMRELRSFQVQFKGEMFFQIGSKIYQLRLAGFNKKELNGLFEMNQAGPLSKRIISDLTEITQLADHFFYTIAVNYSHYAMNANHLGEWVNFLFHKNDGYTTPLVINPMRKNGNFDINDEANFARYRLLSNVLLARYENKDDPKVFISDNHHIRVAKFTLNRNKVIGLNRPLFTGNDGLDGDRRYLDLFKRFISDYLEDYSYEQLSETEFVLKDILVNYILQKITRISQRYPGFAIDNLSTDSPAINDLFTLLKNDGSHITYKLKQAVNLLIRCLNPRRRRPFGITAEQLKGKSKFEVTFTLTGLMRWMGNPKPEYLIERLPPSLFEIDFEVSNHKGDKSSFNALSSGEQQLIHSIQAVTYHLNNLQSAHLSSTPRFKYTAINIIYDEIELYFHPDYQRRFISELLSNISRLPRRRQRSIRGINIIFLTHSPFILSDIPQENILLLEVDKSNGKSIPSVVKTQTFASNINELLANSFFLKGTLMGTLAEKRLKNIVQQAKEGQEISKEDNDLIKIIGDSFLKFSMEELTKRN